MAIFITRKIRRELSAYREIVAPFKNLGIGDSDLAKILQPLVKDFFEQVIKKNLVENLKTKEKKKSTYKDPYIDTNFKQSGGSAGSPISVKPPNLNKPFGW